jgi:hypothetical protein
MTLKYCVILAVIKISVKYLLESIKVHMIPSNEQHVPSLSMLLHILVCWKHHQVFAVTRMFALCLICNDNYTLEICVRCVDNQIKFPLTPSNAQHFSSLSLPLLVSIFPQTIIKCLQLHLCVHYAWYSMIITWWRKWRHLQKINAYEI